MDALRIARTWSWMKGWLARSELNSQATCLDGHHEGLFTTRPWEPLEGASSDSSDTPSSK